MNKITAYIAVAVIFISSNAFAFECGINVPYGLLNNKLAIEDRKIALSDAALNPQSLKNSNHIAPSEEHNYLCEILPEIRKINIRDTISGFFLVQTSL